MDKENQLKDLKDLFSKFVSFVGDSNREPHVSENGYCTNLPSNHSTFSSVSADHFTACTAASSTRGLKSPADGLRVTNLQTEIGNDSSAYRQTQLVPQNSIIRPAVSNGKSDLGLDPIRGDHLLSTMSDDPAVFNRYYDLEFSLENNHLTSAATSDRESIIRPVELDGKRDLGLVPRSDHLSSTITGEPIILPAVLNGEPEPFYARYSTYSSLINTHPINGKYDLELVPTYSNCIDDSESLHNYYSSQSFNNSTYGNDFYSNDVRNEIGYQNALPNIIETGNDVQNCMWNEYDLIDNSTTEQSSNFNITVTEQCIDLLLPTPSPPINVDVRTMAKKNKKTKRGGQKEKQNETVQPCAIDVEPRTRCDNVKMFVPTSGSRTKRLCCDFCHKRYPKLARHLETVHKNEAEVKKMQVLPKDSKERKNIITTIRKRGQFLWNGDEKLNLGELSTARWPTNSTDAFKFKSCPNCLGTYKETTLRKHWNKCTNHPMRDERIVKQLSLTVERRIHSDACEELNQIFARMQNQALVRLIRYDPLVVRYGNNLCLNYHETFDTKFIKKNLGEAGKLLTMAKSISSQITDFSSMYHVKHCNIVIEAIQKVSRFDLKAKTVGAPSTAAALRTLVNNIGQVLLIETMKSDDPEKEKIVERFLKVFNSDAKLKISKLVTVTQANAKRFKQEVIPDTDDVSRLADYLDRERDKCYIELSQLPTDLSIYSSDQYKQYERLSQLTLSSILVFNRKRVGELQNVTIDAFKHREMITEGTGLGVITKETANVIRSRMTIRGKRSSTVRVLLKHAYEDCILFLLNHRKEAGIPESNKYLFARHTQSDEIKVINGCVAIKTFSESCGAQNSASLRGTFMRKHMASFCGTLNLSDNDVTNVAKFMGHSDKIHRDVYRHNSLQREVVQMTAILQAAQGKTVSCVKSVDGQSNDCGGQPDGGDGQSGDGVGQSGDGTKLLKRNKKNTQNLSSENFKKSVSVGNVKRGIKRVAK